MKGLEEGVGVRLEGAQSASSELEQALVWEYHSPVDFMGRITIDPEVRAGKPCIRGTRITVYDLLEYLAGGMSEGDILEDFPSLEPEDVRAALEFAAARERRLASSAA